MNFSRIFVILMSLSLLAVPVHGSVQGNEGGGGDQLIVEFIRIANNLLTDSSIDDSDKEVLRKTLSTTKIVTVLALKNPVTGEVVPNQKTLVAWGSPNLIQLKLSSGVAGEVAWDKIDRRKQSMAHYVFHELYRASGIVDSRGESPDDAFQISIGKYHLDHYIASSSEEECADANRILLESYVLRTTLQRFGQTAKIKIGSEMYKTNLYGQTECIYEISYFANVIVFSKPKEIIGNALFNGKFYRPRAEQTVEVTEFPVR